MVTPQPANDKWNKVSREYKEMRDAYLYTFLCLLLTYEHKPQPQLKQLTIVSIYLLNLIAVDTSN